LKTKRKYLIFKVYTGKTIEGKIEKQKKKCG